MRLAVRATPWALGLVALMLVVLGGCSLLAPKFERPVLSVVSIQLLGGNLMQQSFLVKLNVQNPNDRNLPVSSLHVEMSVAGEEIAHGVSNQSFVVPAHGENQFEMTITTNTALAILKLAGSKNAHADSIDYDMTGGARLDLPFLRELPFHQSGTFSLKSFPGITITR